MKTRVFPIFNILLILMIFFGYVMSANAKIKIHDVKIVRTEGKRAVIRVKFRGILKETPEITVKNKMVQVAFPNSSVWPKIEKKVELGGNQFDTTLLAYQFNRNNSRFRALLPYSLNGKEDQVFIDLKDQYVDISFPLNKAVAKIKPIVKSKKQASNYDESFLKSLIKEKNETKKDQTVDSLGPEKRRFVKNAKKEKQKAVVTPKQDTVSLIQSANERSSFSIASYIGKFVAFLGLVLLLFYGVVQLMRKGILRKGKLGFLSKINAVSVISNTSVGPKKSLMLVKVQDQVFLLGNSENGINLISELKDTTGILKEGEKAVTGNNFDTSLESASSNEKEFKLKEVADEVARKQQSRELTAYSEAQIPVKANKLSDQIKSRVKSLKSF
jgi:flagellar biosynthetic protein FliO